MIREGRIIPARAGFTDDDTHGWLRTGDHPRSRGVYPTTSGQSGGDAGSSPLARGLPRTSTSTNAGRRIIPARAGFTRTGSARHAPPRDHPRSRGVYGAPSSSQVPWLGSSPLARGLLSGRLVVPGLRGIIPARAGFTSPVARPVEPGTDHPRSRGVYSWSPATWPNAWGSSPLARGLLVCFASNDLRHGIIPARAGFTGRHRGVGSRA